MKTIVNCFGIPNEAEVIISCNSRENLRYLCTDFDVTYDGRYVNIDVYEDIYTGDLYAVID